MEIAINRLIDAHRTRALWFLRADVYPASTSARLRALDQIRRHGDRDAYIQAGGLREWLLHHSKDDSANS